MFCQCTLAESVAAVGIGLHSGRKSVWCFIRHRKIPVLSFAALTSIRLSIFLQRP